MRSHVEDIVLIARFSKPIDHKFETVQFNKICLFYYKRNHLKHERGYAQVLIFY